MTITARTNGDLSLDWGPPGGPFITLTPGQYKELVKVICARERLYGRH